MIDYTVDNNSYINLAIKTRNLFFKSDQGIWLINELGMLFSPAVSSNNILVHAKEVVKKDFTSRIKIYLKNDIQKDIDLCFEKPDSNPNGSVGVFHPPESGQPLYKIFIQYGKIVSQWNKFPLTQAGFRTFYTYPENPKCDKEHKTVTFYHRLIESDIAVTLFHELLHVWFINKIKGKTCGIPEGCPTGHTDVEDSKDCLIDERFLTKLKLFSNELAAVQGIELGKKLITPPGFK